jgi:hypothetical protein
MADDRPGLKSAKEERRGSKLAINATAPPACIGRMEAGESAVGHMLHVQVLEDPSCCMKSKSRRKWTDIKLPTVRKQVRPLEGRREEQYLLLPAASHRIGVAAEQPLLCRDVILSTPRHPAPQVPPQYHRHRSQQLHG